MRLAIDQARLGQQTEGGGEVGCVIVEDGRVVARGFNEAGLRHDPTAHAETVTIRRLCAERKTESLEGCTLFCTLQPCAMCTAACVWAGIRRIVYGAGRPEVSCIYFAERHLNAADMLRDAYRDDLEIIGGVLAEECAQFYIRRDEPVPAEKRAADPAH